MLQRLLKTGVPTTSCNPNSSINLHGCVQGFSSAQLQQISTDELVGEILILPSVQAIQLMSPMILESFTLNLYPNRHPNTSESIRAFRWQIH